MPQLQNNDVQGRITVVKLKAKGRNGELGEGTLHRILVKTLAEALVLIGVIFAGKNGCKRVPEVIIIQKMA